jgi:hypothetical protein
LGDTEEALKSYRTAQELGNDLAELNIAAVLEMLGYADEARAILTEAVAGRAALVPFLRAFSSFPYLTLLFSRLSLGSLSLLPFSLLLLAPLQPCEPAACTPTTSRS